MLASLADVVVRIAPIVLILFLGNVIRWTGLVASSTIDDIKSLVVNVALPAVLFIAFLDMNLEPEYLGIFVVVLAVCILLYFYGRGVRRLLGIKHDYFPYLVTGFEFGMVGITLFGAAYGLDQVGYIAIVDVSHELFIWFGFVTMLVAKRDGLSRFGDTVKGFFRSPVIIAIVSGLVLNLLGLGEFIRSFVGTKAIVETLQTLGNLLIPLILIIIGYGMRLSLDALRSAGAVLATRLVVLVPLILLVNALVVNQWLGLAPGFEAAIFTFFILPPPFIVPLFMRQDQVEERTYTNNVLTVYTIVTLVLFIAYFVANPQLG
jgi:predicted permease